ncbi:MAG: hypothetical protein II013_04505 [Lachnobacterium sp.]|nr:hypothetical protein [Lachnobacterium sp.]
MDRLSLRNIVDGANEIQKECKKHYSCLTCFFYTDKYKNITCQIQAYINNDIESVGKNLSLQYLK